MKEKKGSAVVFCLTSNLIFAVANMLFDIKRFSSSWVDEVIIIYDGKLNKKDSKLINSIFPTKFIEYDFPIKDTSIFNETTYKSFTKMVYAKFECLKLLDDYRNVICLDYDIVILRDFKELSLFKDDSMKILHRGGDVKGQFHSPIAGYNMDAAGMCACTFSLHDSLPDYLQIYDFCYAKTKELAPLLMHPEQGILDLAIQEFSITPSVIPSSYFSNTCDPTSIISEQSIFIHSAGSNKFWSGLDNQQWENNHKKWLALGGSQVKNRRKIKLLKNKAKHILHNLLANK